jgi:hypothetical protein
LKSPELRTPLARRSSPRHALIVMCCAFAAALFFAADDFLGAVALRGHYGISGLVFAMWFFLIGMWYLNVSRGIWIGCTVLTLLGGIMGLLVVMLYLTGLVINMFFFLTPVSFVSLSLIIGTLYGLWALYRLSNHRRAYLRQIMTLFCFYMFFYLLGQTMTPEHFGVHFKGGIQQRDKYYILNTYEGQGSDLDPLALYECNLFALNCRAVYRSLGYKFALAEFELRPARYDIQIWINGALYDTYESGK